MSVVCLNRPMKAQSYLGRNVDGFRGSVTLAVRMPRRVRTLVLMLVLVVTFVVAALALALFTMGGTPVLPPLPNPNGYDDFVKANKAVTGDVGNFPSLDRESLSSLISTNAEALRLIRLGLTRQCSLPTESVVTNFPGRNEFAGIRHLAQLLAAEGWLRELENRPADAALSYAEVIHLGNEVSKGGVIVNRLTGIAIEGLGGVRLGNL
jgi:hypothetical protein